MSSQQRPNPERRAFQSLFGIPRSESPGLRGFRPSPRIVVQIQNDLAVLTKRLSHLNDSIARKTASKNEYDKTIQETESAYLKVGDCRCLA